MSDMIRAYQRGDKTQTRRVIVPQPVELDGPNDDGWHFKDKVSEVVAPASDGTFQRIIQSHCPYGRPSDRLLFLEGYQIIALDAATLHVQVRYLSDDTICEKRLTSDEYAKWQARKYPYRATPGRFMYNSLVRYKPTILSVRVERVQDIKPIDAVSEGVTDGRGDDYGPWYVWQFEKLWDFINTKRGYSWDANPWVWVVEFERFTND